MQIRIETVLLWYHTLESYATLINVLDVKPY